MRTFSKSLPLKLLSQCDVENGVKSSAKKKNLTDNNNNNNNGTSYITEEL